MPAGKLTEREMQPRTHTRTHAHTRAHAHTHTRTHTSAAEIPHNRSQERREKRDSEAAERERERGDMREKRDSDRGDAQQESTNAPVLLSPRWTQPLHPTPTNNPRSEVTLIGRKDLRYDIRIENWPLWMYRSLHLPRNPLKPSPPSLNDTTHRGFTLVRSDSWAIWIE